MAENIKVRKFGLIGIASPIIGLLAVLVSIYFSPWFEWPIHALSDLGVAQEGRLISQFAQEGDTQIATWTFNGGMIVAGLLIAIFVLCTRKTIPDPIENIAKFLSLVRLSTPIMINPIGVKIK